MRVSIEGGAEALREELRLRDLVNFVPAASPRYMPPRHLAPLLRRFELAVDGVPQRVCCSAPPRHAKTESVLHVPAFALRRDPSLTISYSTYAEALSRSKSRRARAIVESLGVRTTGGVTEWRTEEGGGLLAGGVGGPLTGHGVNIGIVDDPYKNRVQAESAAYRSMLGDWVRDVLMTRIEPGGSIFVFATRWTPDDIIGELTSEGFEHLNLPAMSASGEALWPERWPADALRARAEEVGDYTWSSLYQGVPRSRGGKVFDDVHTYTTLPVVYRSACGLDVSYSAKTSADWTVSVRMLYAQGFWYVVDVQRYQLHPTAGAPRLRAWAEKYPADIWRWYLSGTETGSAGFMRADVPNLREQPATADKFVRAIQYAAAWNAGKVLLPASAPWLVDFVTEHAGFTGLPGHGHDDIVDAAVACFDELAQGVSAEGPLTAPARETSPLRLTRM